MNASQQDGEAFRRISEMLLKTKNAHTTDERLALRHCAWEKCKQPFRPRKHWQIYHTEKCRKDAWEERHPKLTDWTDPATIDLVVSSLRTLSWDHPLVVAARKAIECQKTRARKKRQECANTTS